MRISSGMAVGSPTVRIAAILVATLLLAVMATGAMVAGATYLAGTAATVVAQDGSGDFETIAEALAAAADGDTILVMPGTYAESLDIDKDITISGEGPREGVILVTDGSGGIVDSYGDVYVARISETDATLKGLTFRGDNAGVWIAGGSPTIDDVLFDHIGQPHLSVGLDGEGVPLWIVDGSMALVTDSAFARSGQIEILGQSSPTLRGNTFSEGTHIYAHEPGDDAVITDNTFSGAYRHAIGIYDPTTMLVEGNTITDSAIGIEVGYGLSVGIDPVIRRNIITGVASGIDIAGSANPTVEGNEIVEAGRGTFVTGSEAVLVGNTVRDGSGGPGLLINAGTPTLRDNTVEGMVIGLFLGSAADPVMEGNTICGNETNVRFGLPAREVPQDLSGNEVCPDAAA